MKRLTMKLVNETIAPLHIQLVKGKGYFYFIETEKATKRESEALWRLETTSVPVYALNHQDLEAWIRDAEAIARKIDSIPRGWEIARMSREELEARALLLQQQVDSATYAVELQSKDMRDWLTAVNDQNSSENNTPHQRWMFFQSLHTLGFVNRMAQLFPSEEQQAQAGGAGS